MNLPAAAAGGGWPTRCWGVAALLCALSTVTNAADVISLGTATPGGGFPVYGEAFAQTINKVDPSLDVQPRNTSGSTENFALLEAGKLDLALVQGEVAHEEFERSGRPPSSVRIISAMYATPGMFAVRADSSYHNIRDLLGQPIAFGARGSGLVLLAREILGGIGLDPDRDFKAIYLERAGDGPAMLQDGRAAALWGGGLGWPGFTAAASQPGGARFLAPNPDEMERILSRSPFLRRLTVPAGSYPGQDTTILSVGSWSFVLARADLPDDVAYRLARALRRGKDTLAARLPTAGESTLENTVAAAPRPELIHPGVRRYLREIGLIK
jgi:TRAP transporter TAXI family solute receptor